MPKFLRNSLSVKIIGMLLLFFLVALASIGVTLSLSWQLKGASAAIRWKRATREAPTSSR